MTGVKFVECISVKDGIQTLAFYLDQNLMHVAIATTDKMADAMRRVYDEMELVVK